jgi:hypothetical protein
MWWGYSQQAPSPVALPPHRLGLHLGLFRAAGATLGGSVTRLGITMGNGYCQVCGKPLVGYRPHAITCGDRCRTALKRQRQRRADLARDEAIRRARAAEMSKLRVVIEQPEQVGAEPTGPVQRWW